MPRKPTLNDGIEKWIRARNKWGSYMTNLRMKALVAKAKKR